MRSNPCLMPICRATQDYDVGVKRYFDPNDATDCSAFHAPAILKTFEIRPIGLLSHVFAGPKVMLFHASMKNMTLGLWHHIIKKCVPKQGLLFQDAFFIQCIVKGQNFIKFSAVSYIQNPELE